jgi:selT/selW/selH-like putative selenoprotein
LAADLKQRYADSDVRLIHGKGGVFDVILDGKMLFSKFDVGRFPEDGEVFSAIDAKT